MKYEFDEKKIRNQVNSLNLEELKEYAFKALRTKELSRIRKQHERKRRKESMINEK